MNDTNGEAVSTDHPRPWGAIKGRSGIAIKDAKGATVLLLAFTGVASRERKKRAASLILEAVNGRP